MVIEQRNAETGKLIQAHSIGPDLCDKVARFNSYLTAQQVEQALLGGRRIYTSFSYYERAAA